MKFILSEKRERKEEIIKVRNSFSEHCKFRMNETRKYAHFAIDTWIDFSGLADDGQMMIDHSGILVNELNYCNGSACLSAVLNDDQLKMPDILKCTDSEIYRSLD